MKKLLVTGITVLMLLAMSACGKKETAQAVEGTSETAEIANPMSMVTEDDSFAKELGFRIDTSVLPVPGMARFIIDGKIAQLRFAIEKDGQAPVEVCFRATKKKELKENLDGLYGDATEPETVMIGEVSVTKSDLTEGERVHHRYAFEKDGIYCSLVVTGELEPQELEELFASFHNAVSKK